MAYIPDEVVEAKINFAAIAELDDVVYDDGSQDLSVIGYSEGSPVSTTGVVLEGSPGLFHQQFPAGVVGWETA